MGRAKKEMVEFKFGNSIKNKMLRYLGTHTLSNIFVTWNSLNLA